MASYSNRASVPKRPERPGKRSNSARLLLDQIRIEADQLFRSRPADTEDIGTEAARQKKFSTPPTQLGGMVIGSRRKISPPVIRGAKVIGTKKYTGVT